MIRLQQQDAKVFDKIGMQKDDINKLIQRPASSMLTPEEWKQLKEIKQKVEECKRELLKKIPQLTDEQQVELERKEHINRRHNVRSKWLPLS